MTAVPDWSGDYLPGSLLSGIGVGLMLPSLGGAATAPLPPERFATGSALYVMSRQIGIALGVAGLVAILGTTTGASAVTAFHHAWVFMIACSLAAGALLQGVGNKVTEVADASLEAEPHDAGPHPRHALSDRRREVGGVRHQQLVAGRPRELTRNRFPLRVEPARAQRGGQCGIVGEAQTGQARRVGVGESRTETELALGDRQGVARHVGLEACAALAVLHHLVQVLAHRLDQLGRGGSSEGRRRSVRRQGSGGGGRRRAQKGEEVPFALTDAAADGGQLHRTRRPRSGASTPAARRWWPT